MKVNTFLRKMQQFVDARIASQMISKLKEAFEGDLLKTALQKVFKYVETFFSRESEAPSMEQALAAAK